MALIIAGCIFALTIVATILVTFAHMMRDEPTPDGTSPIYTTLTMGTVLSVYVASYYWMGG
jgi:heme/copper-type cytochrome/quinol oxidase subunit 4